MAGLPAGSILYKNVFPVVIKRQVVANSAAMADTFTYTTAARGSLPTSHDYCRVMQSAQEVEKYGKNVVERVTTLSFTSDPQVDTRDQITFTDGAGNARKLNVLMQVNFMEMDRVWVVTCEEPEQSPVETPK